MLPPFVTHHPFLSAAFAAVPWIVGPVVTAARLARSRQLADESAIPPEPAPSVAVIIPARNEAHNIAECVRSVLTSDYPQLQVIVVDDHSIDKTGEIARAVAPSDPRLTIITNPDLPPEWFGKQWACQNGADATDASILIFLDADTRLIADTVTRSVNGMIRTDAALYTVISQQEMHTFWERLIQPQMFTMLATRYGGTESVNNSPNASDKIANGQYLMLRRTDYNALGGHALVRAYVAEDLMLAQKYFTAGRTTIVTTGLGYVRTRMYTSLSELIGGWRKNVYAGGREAVPGGKIGQFFFPIMLLVMPLLQLLSPLLLIAALAIPLAPFIMCWAAITTLTWLAWWLFVYHMDDQPLHYALYFPLGALLLTYIFITAIVSGHRVSWKGRQYVNVPHVAD